MEYQWHLIVLTNITAAPRKNTIDIARFRVMNYNEHGTICVLKEKIACFQIEVIVVSK